MLERLTRIQSTQQLDNTVSICLHQKKKKEYLPSTEEMLTGGHDDWMITKLRTAPTVQLLSKVISEGVLGRKQVLI
jgi:hypothetical protein